MLSNITHFVIFIYVCCFIANFITFYSIYRTVLAYRILLKLIQLFLKYRAFFDCLRCWPPSESAAILDFGDREILLADRVRSAERITVPSFVKVSQSV